MLGNCQHLQQCAVRSAGGTQAGPGQDPAGTPLHLSQCQGDANPVSGMLSRSPFEIHPVSN